MHPILQSINNLPSSNHVEFKRYLLIGGGLDGSSVRGSFCRIRRRLCNCQNLPALLNTHERLRTSSLEDLDDWSEARWRSPDSRSSIEVDASDPRSSAVAPCAGSRATPAIELVSLLTVWTLDLRALLTDALAAATVAVCAWGDGAALAFGCA
jgi:hypothetical protein